MIAVITDSAADVDAATAARWGLRTVPLTVTYPDGTEASDDPATRPDPPAFFRRCGTGLARTAAPAPGAFAAAITDALAAGADGVVIVTLAGALSGTVAAARAGAAAAGVDPARVAVLDSGSASVGQALVVRAAIAAAREATDPIAVLAALARLGAVPGSPDTPGSVPGAGRPASPPPDVHLVATLDDLAHLHRGGRLGAAGALVGGVLGVRPIVSVRHGIVSPLGRVRTRARAVAALVDAVRAAGRLVDGGVVHTTDDPDHGAVADEIAQLRAALVAGGVTDPLVVAAGAVIAAHAGPGALGVAWWPDGDPPRG